MPSDAYREARAAAKEARAAADEARQRWLKLRPWYYKKRFILGAPVLLAIAGAVVFLAISPEYHDAAGSSDATGASGTATGLTPIGAAIQAGSIELTVLGLEPFDGRAFSSANDANFRLRLRVTNVRGPAGEDYRLLASAFQLVDAEGVMQGGWHTTCQSCPDSLDSERTLAYGTTIEAAVYFRIPADQTAGELQYRAPGSASTGRVALR